MRVILNIIIAICIIGSVGCEKNSSDPKVQGAIQIERMVKDGNKQALNESVKLVEQKIDFIVDTSNAEICIYESDGPHIEKTELGVKIEKTFQGRFEKNTTFYASKLPIGTKVFYETIHSTQYRYAEVSKETDRIYRCQQYFGEKSN